MRIFGQKTPRTSEETQGRLEITAKVARVDSQRTLEVYAGDLIEKGQIIKGQGVTVIGTKTQRVKSIYGGYFEIENLRGNGYISKIAGHIATIKSSDLGFIEPEPGDIVKFTTTVRLTRAEEKSKKVQAALKRMRIANNAVFTIYPVNMSFVAAAEIAKD